MLQNYSYERIFKNLILLIFIMEYSQNTFHHIRIIHIMMKKNTHYLRFSSQNPKIPKYISAQNINGAPANVSTANPIICSP